MPERIPVMERKEQSRSGWLDAGSSMAHVGILGWPADIRAHKGGPGNAGHQANAARFVCTQMLRPAEGAPFLICLH